MTYRFRFTPGFHGRLPPGGATASMPRFENDTGRECDVTFRSVSHTRTTGGTRHFCNCSPLLGGRVSIVQLDHVGGLSGKRDLDGDEGIVSERGHRAQVA